MENKEPSPVELLKMFADGAKIRHKNWNWKEYVFLRFGKVVNQLGIYTSLIPNLSSILDGEYELYREPKKLKRFWLWDIKSSGWRRLSEYYDEKGMNTDGLLNYTWSHLEKRKAEPEQFIDVEVEE